MCFHSFPKLAEFGCASESPGVLVKHLILRVHTTLLHQNLWEWYQARSPLLSLGYKGQVLCLSSHALDFSDFVSFSMPKAKCTWLSPSLNSQLLVWWISNHQVDESNIRIHLPTLEPGNHSALLFCPFSGTCNFFCHFNLLKSLKTVSTGLVFFHLARTTVVISAFSRDFGSQNFSLEWKILGQTGLLTSACTVAVSFTNTGSDWGSKTEISLKPLGALWLFLGFVFVFVCLFVVIVLNV